LRVKLGHKKGQDDEVSIPSDISGDEWAEILRYEKERYEEDKRREKEQFEYKKKQIRDTLERQLKERNQQK
jgi:hypothetical protein